MHSPPNSSTCTSGSLKGARATYTSGRHTASTSSATTAHHAPHSRPTSPANDSTAHPPRTAGISSAPPSPPSHVPPASMSGNPGRNAGVIDAPDTLNPVAAKSSPTEPPNAVLPNAVADSGIRAVPCPAIQYPYCR